jgi:hypothetical protein
MSDEIYDIEEEFPQDDPMVLINETAEKIKTILAETWYFKICFR